MSYRSEGLATYLSNLQNFAGICWQRDVHCLMVLQPTLGGSDRPWSARDREIIDELPYTNWLSSVRSFYDGAREAFGRFAADSRNGRAFFVDFAGIFDDVDEQIYNDSSHYFESGNRIIAERLAEELMTRVDFHAVAGGGDDRSD